MTQKLRASLLRSTKGSKLATLVVKERERDLIQCRIHLLFAMSKFNDVEEKILVLDLADMHWNPDFTMYKLCDSEQII